MSAARLQGEINVTPLIDILLVLLTVFMLIAPQRRHGLDAGLPLPNGNTSSPDPAHPPVVTLEAQGLALDGQPLGGTEDLRLRLGEALLARRDRTLLVAVVGEVPYGRVVEVLDAARGAGAERLGLLPAQASRSTRNP